MDTPAARAGRRPVRDTTVSIRLTGEAARFIDGLATREERTRSDMIRVLLREGIDARRRR